MTGPKTGGRSASISYPIKRLRGRYDLRGKRYTRATGGNGVRRARKVEAISYSHPTGPLSL